METDDNVPLTQADSTAYARERATYWKLLADDWRQQGVESLAELCDRNSEYWEDHPRDCL